jgi:hypothetical protein
MTDSIECQLKKAGFIRIDRSLPLSLLHGFYKESIIFDAISIASRDEVYYTV